MIVLFGLAGSGKSTQGKILAENNGWRWLSVGEVLRNTGKFDEILKAGELVDDMEVVKLMDEEIKKAKAEGFDIVLDGYPRDIVQAEWLATNDKLDDFKKAIYLEVPKEILLERIEGRGRTDDTDEVIKKRFQIVEQNICSILSLLEQSGVEIIKMDGTGTIEEVNKRIQEVI